MITLHPSYFMDVYSLIHAYHATGICWDVHDSFVKQTYRNRCYIAAANGKLSLQIPIIHTQKVHSIAYNQVQIDHTQPWVNNHLKSIESAYRSSPFYEYYKDSFIALYDSIPDSLQQWNLRTAHYLLRKMNIDKKQSYSDLYTASKLATQLITAKNKQLIDLPAYMQVFQEKHGFIQPLSGVDLLFNEGPSAGVYLKNANTIL